MENELAEVSSLSPRCSAAHAGKWGEMGWGTVPAGALVHVDAASGAGRDTGYHGEAAEGAPDTCSTCPLGEIFGHRIPPSQSHAPDPWKHLVSGCG